MWSSAIPVTSSSCTRPWPPSPAACSSPSSSWRFAWQSAGHTQAEWLKPDLLDVLPELAAAGATEVLVAPVQFVADHLETLYDIDVAAAEQAAVHGLRFRRIAMPNTSPAFIRGLAEVVERELSGSLL